MTTDNREWVLVPRDPTPEMVLAGRNVDDLADRHNALRIYRAMIAAAPPPPTTGDGGSREASLTFNAFRRANVARCVKWHPEGIASWSPSDWLTAVTGELGELASLLKMRNRERDGLPGNKFSPTDKQVADELADVLTYLDLLAEVLGVDLGRAAVEKFNEVSERVGFPDRIVLATPASAPPAAKGEDGAPGPRLRTKAVCDGCPMLKTEYWRDELDNDETDSGTRATCAAANRDIDVYWHAGQRSPDWCPHRTATPPEPGSVAEDAVERAAAAWNEYWNDPVHSVACSACKGAGAVPFGCDQDLCGDCGGDGFTHEGTEEGAMRAALTAARKGE